MTIEPHFQIASFKTDEACSPGFYSADTGEVGKEMRRILAHFEAGHADPLPIPALEGMQVRITMIGNSCEIEVTKTHDAEGEPLDLALPISKNFVATEAADEANIRKAARAAADAAGEAAVGRHPDWIAGIENGGATAPFTAIVPSGGLVAAHANGLVTLHEIRMTAGFLQNLIGSMFELCGFTTTTRPFAEQVSLDSASPAEVAGAVQTGGILPGALIVMPGEDEYPEVYAYLADAELDVVRVDFTSDTIEIDTDGMSYLTFDGDTLQTLARLRAEADEVWDEALDLLDAFDASFENEEAAIEAAAAEDPIAHLYTGIPRIAIPDDLSQRLQATLGVSRRYGPDGRRIEEKDEDAAAT